MRLPKVLRRAIGATIMASLASASVIAQNAFPSRPVTLIVPYAPGGAVDGTARALAQELGKSLGQSVIVENKPGASGMLGASILKRAPADGQTLLFDTPASVMNPLVHAKPLFEAKDLRPVAQVMQMPYVIAIAPDVGNSFADLMAQLRAKPGALNAASSGTSSQLFAELFGLQTRTRFLHIVYSGAAPALLSVMKNETQLTAMDVPNIESFITSGKLHGVVVTGSKRSPALPNVPAASEVGIPGFDATTWYGVFAPNETPTWIVERLNEHIRKALKTKDVADYMLAHGATPVDASASDFAAFYLSEVQRWKTVVQQAGIELQ